MNQHFFAERRLPDNPDTPPQVTERLMHTLSVDGLTPQRGAAPPHKAATGACCVVLPGLQLGSLSGQGHRGSAGCML